MKSDFKDRREYRPNSSVVVVTWYRKDHTGAIQRYFSSLCSAYAFAKNLTKDTSNMCVQICSCDYYYLDSKEDL